MRMLDISPYYWEKMVLTMGFTLIAPKSINRYKEQVKSLWDARQSLTSKQLVKQWRQYSIGWWNYFKLAENLWNIKRWEGWTRRYMRKCFWLRWHNKKGRLKALCRLGASARLQKTASSSRGAWRISKSPALHKVLSNSALKRHGLFAPSELTAA